MPYSNPFREDRQRRMQELLTLIQNQGELDLDWILGWGGLKWGSTEPALNSMLAQLDKARVIEVDIEHRSVKSLIPKTDKPPTPTRPPAKKPGEE